MHPHASSSHDRWLEPCSRTSSQVGLAFTADWDKPGGFIGRAAALAQKRAGAGALPARLVQVLLRDPGPLLFHTEVLYRCAAAAPCLPSRSLPPPLLPSTGTASPSATCARPATATRSAARWASRWCTRRAPPGESRRSGCRRGPGRSTSLAGGTLQPSRCARSTTPTTRASGGDRRPAAARRHHLTAVSWGGGGSSTRLLQFLPSVLLPLPRGAGVLYLKQKENVRPARYAQSIFRGGVRTLARRSTLRTDKRHFFEARRRCRIQHWWSPRS